MPASPTRLAATRNQSRPGFFTVPIKRFIHIHLDLIGPFEESRGFRYALTIMDRTTSFPEAVPLKDKTADSVTDALTDRWIPIFGCPATITSDNGNEFTNAILEEATKKLGTNVQFTPTYHPESNGLVERLHRDLKSAIKCKIGTEK